MAETWKSSGWEDVGLVLFDLVKGAAGANITQASLTSLTAKVFNADTLSQISTTITLAIADCIFDTVKDASDDVRYTGVGGYNFRATIPGSYFPDGDQTYLIEVYFTDTSSNVIPDRWEHTTMQVIGT
jgi:hypothetical protein